MYTIRRLYYAEAAHRLTAGVPEGHKCRRLHGHRYEIEFAVNGTVWPDGMIVEYGALDEALAPLLDKIDHRDLNTLRERAAGPLAEKVSANPTVEHLMMWLAFEGAIAVACIPGRNVKLVGITIREDAAAMLEWRDRGST